MLVSSPVQSPAIWLIPFVQLKSVARQAWRARFGGAVMPQIMTLREWAASVGTVAKRSDDLHFDPALDRLTAQRLMHSVAKSTGHRTDPALVQRLLDAAYELAAPASALPPAQRPAWISRHHNLFDAPVFQYEAVIQFLALSWAGGSRYDVDVLWQRRSQLLNAASHIYVSEGLQPESLQAALLAGYEPKTTVIELGVIADLAASSQTQVVAIDAEDTVQQTVGLIKAAQQTASQQHKMALVALDRQITRRVSAALHGLGIAVHDETGWALSTTTAAAQLLAWLAAMTRSAHSDEVLAAMKTAPQVFEAKAVDALEMQIREKAWLIFPVHLQERIQSWRGQWVAPRTAVAWLTQTRTLLQATQLQTAFEADAAGQALLAALHLDNEAALQRLAALEAANDTMSLQAYSQWVRAVLEASRFKPAAAAQMPAPAAVSVTILPLPQLWGRTFDAVILPGCDAVRLPARPQLTGDWRAHEREALNLLTLEAAAAAHQKAWDWVCAQPAVTLLRHTSEGNERLLPSVLLQRLQVAGRLSQAAKSTTTATSTTPTVIPANAGIHACLATTLDVFKHGVAIDWQHLAPKKLSASSYADLRACPYRFYATRLLGLTASDELDGTVDKRDFGTWLHGTLHRFHEALKRSPTDLREELIERLNLAAAAEQAALQLDAAAFLPFSLMWPQTREAYLAWHAQHLASGYRYSQGEVRKTFALNVEGQPIELVGQLDRIDSFNATHGKGLLLMDYKTESASKTKARLSQADEDTQLAFYAALIHNDPEHDTDTPVQAAYVNLAERLADVKTNKDGASEQLKLLPDLEAQRDALLDGIWRDLSNMAQGHGLRALGQGAACEHCQARGLCRKDFQ